MLIPQVNPYPRWLQVNTYSSIHKRQTERKSKPKFHYISKLFEYTKYWTYVLKKTFENREFQIRSIYEASTIHECRNKTHCSSKKWYYQRIKLEYCRSKVVWLKMDSRLSDLDKHLLRILRICIWIIKRCKQNDICTLNVFVSNIA